MTQAKKRISVSEETWKMLGNKKEAGQTYDELIKELIQRANRHELSEKMRKVEKGEVKLVPLE